MKSRDDSTAQDRGAFDSNLAALVQICTRLAKARPAGVAPDEHQAARNVQAAFAELDHQVSLEVAAAVWRHYSNSILACWLTGAETPASAEAALRSYVQHAPPGGFTPEPPGPAGWDFEPPKADIQLRIPDLD